MQSESRQAAPISNTLKHSPEKYISNVFSDKFYAATNQSVHKRPLFLNKGASKC